MDRPCRGMPRQGRTAQSPTKFPDVRLQYPAWAATTEYLDRAIDGYSFRLVPFTSPDALSDAAQRGQLEFAITSPSSLVQLEVRQGARALLDLVGRWQDKPLTRMGGVLFTSATRKGINVVRDMAGKTLMAVSNNSFGGWLTIKGELLEQDFDPTHDLAHLIFAGGSPKDVVRAVLDGKADVGAVRTGVLERMAAAGEISMSDVKIIRSHPKEGFPLAHSTDLYPEWKLAVMAGTDPALARDVAGALLQIAPESPMAKRGGYFHWTLPTGEQSVHLLLQHLRAPPYEDFGKITLAGLIQAYWGWLLALAGTIAGLLVLAIYALRKNALLRQRTEELCTIHETELGFQRQVLDEHLIVSMADAQGRIIYVNDKFIEISGYERDELIGQTHALLKSGHHSPEFYRDMWDTLKQGKAWTGEIRNRRKDGSHYWVKATIMPFLGRDGKIEKYVSLRTDITDVKEAEIQRQLATSFDFVEDEVYMFWPDNRRFFYANKAALRRNGLTEDEILYLTPTDLKDGLTDEECRSILKPMIRGEMSTATFEREFHQADGSWTAAEITIQFIHPEGHEPRFVATIKDISEKRAAQDEAKLLSQSLDLIQDEIYLFWPDSYDFVYLNESAAARAEADGLKWRGHRVDEFISASQFAALKKRCEALVRGPARSFSYELVDRNKRTIEVYLHLVQPKGAKPRFLAIYRDITERKVAEKAKSEFVSTVSHELRTPLTSIKGALGLIEAGAGGELPDKAATLVSLANKNCDHLVLLINDLLDLDKLTSGKIELKEERVSLSELIHEAIEGNRGYGEKYGVRFVATRIQESLDVSGDRDRLRQVLDNLMSNAAKFSKQGDRVELSVIGKDDAAVISVKDYGSGIPEEARERIFERFTQADSSDQRQKGGTGLGLNIAKSIVELHHGRISFVSQVGEGTEFFVELPIMVAKEMEEQDDERRTG